MFFIAFSIFVSSLRAHVFNNQETSISLNTIESSYIEF